jgi:hypothetical protein
MEPLHPNPTLGVDRETARDNVWERVEDVLNSWRATNQ